MIDVEIEDFFIYKNYNFISLEGNTRIYVSIFVQTCFHLTQPAVYISKERRYALSQEGTKCVHVLSFKSALLLWLS